MAVKQNFKEASGGDVSPYTRLLEIFVHIRDWSDSYEIARVKKWQARDPVARVRALEEMSQIRHAILSRLSDPAHDVEALLRDAALEKDNLSLPHQGNLQQMQKTFDEMRAFMPFGKKAPQQDLLAYEQTLDRAFRGWAATLAYAESDPQRAWQNQIDHVMDTIVTIGETMRPVAQARGVSLYEACLQKLCPGMTEKSVTDMFSSLRTDYAGMTHAIRRRDGEMSAGRPLPLPSVPVAAQSELFGIFHRTVLQAAGWEDDLLAEHNIVMKMSTAQTGYSWGSRQNITIAVESYENDFMKSLLNCFHELGHMTYLLQLNHMPEEQRHQMLATFNGFGAHEFAAMNFEMIAQRRPFFALAAPLIHEVIARHGMDASDPALSAENLYKTANRPDLNRHDWGASELVLAPNMAFRAEAERDMLNALERPDHESLRHIIEALPVRWADTMEAYLGAEARPDPATFFIGESHWFEDLVGYFPAYMQGAIAAAQMQLRYPPVQTNDLSGFLRHYIEPMKPFFEQGASQDAVKMIAETVGGPMDTSIYMSRLYSAARPGMPGPDAVPAKNNAGARPASSLNLSF